MRTRTAFLFPLMAGLTLVACDTPTEHQGNAHLRILLTDAPSDYIESAVVEIGRIEILPANDGPPEVIVEDAGSYDLLDLQNGVTADLGIAPIDAGDYSELRMFVESAEITLAAGYEFNDGTTTRTLFVPSGAQTGIKIKLMSPDGDDDAGVTISQGETVLVVDFDVAQNFVIQGNPETPAGIHGILFTPVLRAIVRDVAGSIAGTVAAPAGVAVEGLTVTATREGAEDADATTLVNADGTFLLPFMTPGTYGVTVAAPDGHSANVVQVTVAENQAVTGVALTITAD
jgi:hypothetical protein